MRSDKISLQLLRKEEKPAIWWAFPLVYHQASYDVDCPNLRECSSKAKYMDVNKGTRTYGHEFLYLCLAKLPAYVA